jgi:hypothetical protein
MIIYSADFSKKNRLCVLTIVQNYQAALKLQGSYFGYVPCYAPCHYYFGRMEDPFEAARATTEKTQLCWDQRGILATTSAVLRNWNMVRQR